MSNDFDLDKSILVMTREELLEEVADRIQCTKELMLLHRKEELMLRQENKVLQDALSRIATSLKDSTKTISVWKNTSYLLTVILIVLAATILIK
ncbi:MULTISPECIES: hypothetical protein [unclassified Acinetobacter]|uniref:hypothetical protein n=1 Tax=unclassified Acinetobacter TaxID=196816 RepID=UPI0015D21444|nr:MULTISPECIES: hypothetical protein [unclassified Acinetobacter]